MKITARKRTRCKCGCWVNPGDIITWSSETKRTTGCKHCGQTGYPPDCPDSDDIRWDRLGN